MSFDVIVVGGGPVGLAFARSLAGKGLRLALVERQPLTALAEPASDGREIALTRRSKRILDELGAWRHLEPADIAPLRAARVLNGDSSFALAFDPAATGDDRLGHLVSNHRIRAALFRTVEDQPGLDLMTGVGVASIRHDSSSVAVRLTDGREIEARLLVAADSRFSRIRDQLGIPAAMNPLGRSMMVARMAHDKDHRGIATEWFGHGQTIAMLPLNGRLSSAVLTLSAAEMSRIATLDTPVLGEEITRRFGRLLGSMRLVGGLHIYPLTTSYARHFVARRAALIGDAAVGMHPVTAHGFNLGLVGQETLARLIASAQAKRSDIASPNLLRDYERAHRLATRPLYTATNLLVRLYTEEGRAARLLRHATLRVGARLPLVRRTVTSLLMQN
ncbi:5-demethoxyubiquinol-8 5-hydroxylase UbiM [Sphingomonas sp. AP4-R1]|uniref:5-demethoxyubiquinol-8 5-hydroxylase UbiM n=1 Tax=Sphingomonas sp. AP4-R1 TaxID=2735134 RepID=UPI001493C051|nr:5-demethoxyubiquinol-8 5-hydroxylase UbiM [Sphingomonas sp. AP4-R1]QJU60137.1 5-demethoxyubiquinol-8 5-hydroxylase UbiM [Sphingomonas sp. AP4-R1]